MKKIELAWAAGIIDGEGCIALVHQKAESYGRAVTDRFNLILKVTMCCSITPKRLFEIFKIGSMSSRKPNPGERVSRSYTWICNTRQAEVVLALVYPYLWTKKKEADVALEFLALPLSKRGGYRGSKPIDRRLQRQRMSCWRRLGNLKTRNRFRTKAEKNRVHVRDKKMMLKREKRS